MFFPHIWSSSRVPCFSQMYNLPSCGTNQKPRFFFFFFMLPSVSRPSYFQTCPLYITDVSCKHLCCCLPAIFFIYCNGLLTELLFSTFPSPRAFSRLRLEQSSKEENLSMSPLSLKHVNDFCLLLEKTEILPKTFKLPTLANTLLFLILCSCSPPVPSCLRALVHAGLIIWNVYSFFLAQCSDHFWGKPSLILSLIAPDSIRAPSHSTVNLPISGGISPVTVLHLGFPRWLSGKESACQCRSGSRSHGFHPGVGKIPWRRKWQPTQYSCLENPMDKEAWWATVHSVAKELGRT